MEKEYEIPEKKHKQQVTLQILLPISATLILCLVGLFLIVNASANSNSNFEQWSHISLIFMIFPMLLAGLVILGLLIGGIYLLSKGNKSLPPSLSRIRLIVIFYLNNAQNSISAMAHRIIALRSRGYAFRSLFGKKQTQTKDGGKNG